MVSGDGKGGGRSAAVVSANAVGLRRKGKGRARREEGEEAGGEELFCHNSPPATTDKLHPDLLQ